MATCKPCRHHQRDEIDKAIINGTPLRSISATYSLSTGSLCRHKAHVRDLVLKAIQARDEKGVAQGSPLLARLEEIITAAKGLAARASRIEQYAVANQALNTIVRCAELMARASGEIQSPGVGIHFTSIHNKTVNINVQNNDVEIAQLVGEATAGFNFAEFQRLKLLAESAEKQS